MGLNSVSGCGPSSAVLCSVAGSGSVWLSPAAAALRRRRTGSAVAAAITMAGGLGAPGARRRAAAAPRLRSWVAVGSGRACKQGSWAQTGARASPGWLRGEQEAHGCLHDRQQ